MVMDVIMGLVEHLNVCLLLISSALKPVKIDVASVPHTVSNDTAAAAAMSKSAPSTIETRAIIDCRRTAPLTDFGR